MGENATKVLCSLHGGKIEIAEESKTYLTLVNRVCYYNRPNFNNTMLPYPDDENGRAEVEAFAKTLVDMPVQAKYAVNAKGQPTFRGHEVQKDKNGNYVFGTQSIGTHTEVWIAEDDVVLTDGTTEKLPCLFAKQKIWKRYGNYIAAVRRLFAEGRLHNSWEIECSAYEYKDGVKILKTYEFEGNAFLGWDLGYNPAYGPSASVLSLASEDAPTELMVAQELSKDLQESEVNKKMDNENFEVEVAVESEISGANPENAENIHTAENTHEPSATEGALEGEEMAGQEESPAASEEGAEGGETVEVSMMTERDLRRALYEALAKDGMKYPWIAFLFPADNIAWVKDEESEKRDLYFVEVQYAIEEGNVSIVSKTEVELMASPRDFNNMLSQRDEKIKSLEKDVSSLSEYKEKWEAEEQRKEAEEKARQVASLRNWAEERGCFTEEELSQDGEIGKLISELKTLEVKAMAADRMIARQRKDEGQKEVSSVSDKPRSALESDGDVRSAMWKKFINA